MARIKLPKSFPLPPGTVTKSIDLSAFGITKPVKAKRKPPKPLPWSSILDPSPDPSHAPGPWEIEIPGWIPTPLNVLLKSRWDSAKLKRKDAIIIGSSLRLGGVPRATGLRRVGLVIVLGPRMRSPDVDAFWKSTLDGMVRCGALVDDNRKWVEILPVQYERAAEKGTRIRIEDC